MESYRSIGDMYAVGSKLFMSGTAPGCCNGCPNGILLLDVRSDREAHEGLYVPREVRHSSNALLLLLEFGHGQGGILVGIQSGLQSPALCILSVRQGSVTHGRQTVEL